MNATDKEPVNYMAKIMVDMATKNYLCKRSHELFEWAETQCAGLEHSDVLRLIQTFLSYEISVTLCGILSVSDLSESQIDTRLHEMLNIIHENTMDMIKKTREEGSENAYH